MPDSRHPAEFAASFSALSTQLACPACHGDLDMDDDRLACRQCGQIYPIVDGIPVLIPEVSR